MQNKNATLKITMCLACNQISGIKRYSYLTDDVSRERCLFTALREGRKEIDCSAWLILSQTDPHPASTPRDAPVTFYITHTATRLLLSQLFLHWVLTFPLTFCEDVCQ